MRKTIFPLVLLIPHIAYGDAPTANQLIINSEKSATAQMQEAQQLIDTSNRTLGISGLMESAQELVSTSESLSPKLNGSNRLQLSLENSNGIDLDALIANYSSPLKQKTEDQTSTPLPSLMVFVSSSMPSTLMAPLAKQTVAAKGSMVLNGFIGGKLSTTVTFMNDLIQETGVHIIIDPTMYELFDVKSVPTILVTNEPLKPCNPDNGACNRQQPVHDRIKGNVTLYHALEQFAWHGDTANNALEHLNALNASGWESINEVH
ncbi:type-F conjugative transfer system pilin assembly protein TrbC [Vibrio mediterranei]|uniref:Type-F conjugative transfer system pilin assembly protein TrbC n=1 Tax=Vibrio mediterranei TaxID=689 RepID=A0ABX5D671_9VIBR|nr:type-F conjugative transfer system pilin assembly protein TrbC [Vibrio mediterranei]PRQ65184.1 type-F conjugative transfer system pilin assembly protein TrbC [Vibrio mediterranei]